MNEPVIPLLVVEDDPVFALFVQQLVRALSPEVRCATEWVDSAEKAFEMLERQGFDLVLLDYQLPGASGLDVLTQIQQLPAARQPAVIMLTASGNEAVAVEAMKRGAKDYLPKMDLDVAPLLRAVKSALAQRRLAGEVARYNSQLQSDLEMARRLQQSLLPDKYPAFPPGASAAESALRFEHRFQPTAALAGDFFSVLALSPSAAGVFICDVMGHGVRSALVTAMLRALVDELAPAVGDPGNFLTEMNRKLALIFRQTEGPLFATAFYLVADSAIGQLRYASAGHPSPLLLRRQTGEAWPLALQPRGGPALGLYPQSTYATSSSSLAPFDLVLLFTDGVYEALNGEGVEFGKERLLAAARKLLRAPLSGLLDGVLSEVRKFSAGREFDDDVCLLGMEARVVGGKTDGGKS